MEGTFKEGIIAGKGIKFYENGNKRMEGEWVDGNLLTFYY